MLKHSLARRQSLWLIGAALLVSLAITPVRIWMASDMAQASERKADRLQAEQLAQRMAARLDAAETIARDVQTMLATPGLDANTRGRLLARLQQRHADAVSIRAAPVSAPFADRSTCPTGCWLSTGAGDGGNATSSPRILYALPDRGSDRLIVVELPASLLRSDLLEVSKNQTVASLLDPHAQRRLLHPDPELDGTALQTIIDPARTPDPAHAQRILAGQAGAAALAWSTHRQQMVRYQSVPVAGTPWRVLLGVHQQYEHAQAYRLAIRQLTVQLAAIALLALILYLYLRRSLAPLGALDEAADRIAEGDFGVALPQPRHPDEIGRLAAAFRNMRDRLQSTLAELEHTSAIRQTQQTTMDVARQIQNAMLPSTSMVVADVPGVDIAATLMPQRQVGGDLYTFFAIGEQLFFVIGDVADKGVPAALLMARTTSLAQALAPYTPKPDDLLAAINDEIARDNHACMFVTMLCGLLDTVTGRLVIASAGHEAAICLNPRGQAEWLLPDENGPALGLYADAYYPSTEVQLQPGQMLLLYTDGITEAEDAHGRHFGEEAMLRALSSEALSSAHDVITHTLSAVKAHAGEADQSDDMALLCVRWMPPEHIQTVDITNRMSEVFLALNWLEDIAIVLHASVDTALTVRLVAEELLTNTMRYGFAEHRDGRINLTLWRRKALLTLRITDNAAPFDSSIPPPERSGERSDAERSSGGEGLTLVHALSSAIRYYPKLHGNIVEIDFGLQMDAA